MLYVLKTVFCLMCLTHELSAHACCSSCKSGKVCESESVSHDKKGGEFQQKMQTSPQLLVFVSFEIPMDTLKSLITSVNSVGGKAIFRGLVEGEFKKSALKFKKLIEEVLIDPTLFERHDVRVVPKFLLSSSDNGKIDTLSGNVSLLHVLEEFAQKGDNKEIAQKLLTKLKESK